MRNFDYIRDLELDELYRFCSAAEENQVCNPDICAVNASRALEYIVRALYLMKNIDVPERTSLFELVGGEPFRDFISDERVMMAVHYVRKVGNNVAALIRSLIGVDRKEAMRKFGDFISGSELNADQEDFLASIVSYVCENGDITKDIVVNEAPFVERLYVFTAFMQPLAKYIDSIHNVIMPSHNPDNRVSA